MEEQFRIVQDQIEALQASLTAGRTGGQPVASVSQTQQPQAEISQRLSRIEERLDYLTQKWLAVDQELFRSGSKGSPS